MGRLAKSITRIKTKIRETRLLLRTRFQDKLQAKLAFLDLRQAEKSLNTLKTKKNIHSFKIDYLRSIFRDRQAYTKGTERDTSRTDRTSTQPDDGLELIKPTSKHYRQDRSNDTEM